MLVGAGLGLAIGSVPPLIVAWIVSGLCVAVGLLLIRYSKWRQSGLLMEVSVRETLWRANGVEYRGFDHEIRLWHEEKTLQPFRVKVTLPKNPKTRTAFILAGTTVGRRHSDLKRRWWPPFGRCVFTAQIDQPVLAGKKALIVFKDCLVSVGKPKDIRYFYND